MKPTDPVAEPLLPELLPCPFCGSAKIIEPNTVSVACADCGASIGPIGLMFKTARQMWNGRARIGTSKLYGRPLDEDGNIELTRTPLPPRADWALEAANAIQAKYRELNPNSYVTHPGWERIQTIILSEAPAAPDGEDAARLENFRDMVLNGRGPLEAALDNDQTNAVLAAFDEVFPLRAALDEARGQKE